MQKKALIVVLLAAFVYYLTFAPPNEYLIDIKPESYSNELFKSFDGPLAHNTILSNAEHLLVNQIHGPESIVTRNGHLYTATFGGMVVRIEGSKIIPIAKIGNGKCDVPWEVNKCGRPLGLRFNSKGTLYVVDAYHGLYMIQSIDELLPNVTQLLPLSATKNLKGGASVFFDDITVDEGAGDYGGDIIYISDVSTKWDLSNFAYTLIEHDTTGRLLRYHIDIQRLTVMDDGFVFPNGVQIADNRKSVIVCELGKNRLMKTFIRGPSVGRSRVFANLPGPCDNIRRSANTKESYWVAFASVSNSSSPLLLDRLSDSPMLRKFLTRLSFFAGTIMETIGELIDSEALKSTGYSFKRGMPFLYSAYGYGMIAEYDTKGEIITAYSSPGGETSHLSEVLEMKGENDEQILYLGSYSNSYLGRLVIKK